jgi:alpha-amylase
VLLPTLLVHGCATTSAGRVAATAGGPVRVEPQRDWSDAILYFVILDRFANGNAANDSDADVHNPGGWHGGDFAGLEANLDEIASLGATAIWITPVVDQIDYCPLAQGPPPATSFEHCGFHGYWADDFNALDSHFGTEAELSRLVAAAHARGIKVLLDVVYNHTGYGSRYETDPATRAWVRKADVSCDADPIICQVGGLPDLRTELPEVQDYLLNAHLGLARRVGLDGFRLDTVKHVDHPFWQRHRRETRVRLGDDFFLLAEVWGGSATVLDEYFADDEVDAGFDFTFRGECRAFVDGKGRAIAYSAYLERRHRSRAGYHLAHYLSSHDEPMQLHELDGDKDAFRMCVALQMTSVGIPVIYYGEEVARAGDVWPRNRGDMPWGARPIAPGRGLERDEALREWYRRLISIRRAHPALRAGSYRRLSADGDLLVFAREDAASHDAVIVAVNRGQAAASVSVPRPEVWGPDAGIDGLSGEPVTGSATSIDVRVAARGVRVYVGS